MLFSLNKYPTNFSSSDIVFKISRATPKLLFSTYTIIGVILLLNTFCRMSSISLNPFNKERKSSYSYVFLKYSLISYSFCSHIASFDGLSNLY